MCRQEEGSKAITQARSLLTEPANLASRRLALTLLDEATRASKRLNDSADAEALHDFRVSLRRLRAFLQAYRGYLGKPSVAKLRREIAQLMSRTNMGRDTQVHVAWLRQQSHRLTGLQHGGIDLMLETLSQEMQTTAPFDEIIEEFNSVEGKLRKRLSRAEKAAQPKDVSENTGFAEATSAVLAKLSAKLGKQLGQIKSPQDADPLHQARLSVKKLRYVLEPLRKELVGGRGMIQQLKNLQEILGELHDLDTLELRIVTALESSSQAYSVRLFELAVSESRVADIVRNIPELQRCHALAALIKYVYDERKQLFARLTKTQLVKQAEEISAQIEEFGSQLVTPPVDLS